MLGDGVVDHIGEKHLYSITQVVALENVRAVAIDGFALAVENVVILENVLANLGVAGLDLRLGRANRPAHNARLDSRVVGDVASRHDRLGGTRVEQAHEVIRQRQVEAALTGVTLTTGATTQLVVDTARLVALGAEHIKTTHLDDLRGLFGNLRPDLVERRTPRCFVLFGRLGRIQALCRELRNGEELGVTTEHDVGTTTGHVCGYRYGTEAAGLRDDGRFTCVVLRVQNFVTDALLREQLRQVLALLNAGRTDENRLPLRVALGDVARNHLKLDDLVLVDDVGVVFTNHGAVRRNRNHTELVGAHELAGFGLSRTGHARKLLVHAEVVLQRHRSEGLVLSLDLDAFFGLNRLVNTFVVAAAGENTAGVLIHNQNFTVHHDIVFVALEQGHRLDRVVQERNEWRVCRLVQVVDAEVVLDFFDTGLQHTHGALLLIHFVVFAFDERLCDCGEFAEPTVSLARRRTRDDEWRARLVDQNRVNLVDDGKVMTSLHALR